MMETWIERTKREIDETLFRIENEVAAGRDVTDAINANAHTAETYAAALNKYHLKPIIPD